MYARIRSYVSSARKQGLNVFEALLIALKNYSTAIDDLGYVYNQTAANLRNKRSNQIGLVLHDITNPFFSEMTAALSREMENHDLMLFLANSEESSERQQKFIESLLSHNASGLVLCPARETSRSFLASLKRRQIPIILAVRSIPELECDFVGTDNILGAQMATQHLISQGHRNIAFVGGKPDSQARSHRLGGYISKLIEHGISPKEEWTLSCDASRSAGADAMAHILENCPEITAVLCFQDIVALGAMRTLRDKKLKIGRDIAIVGFDDIEEANSVHPGLTTVSVSAQEIGRKAGELLYSRISGNDEPHKSIIIQPKLIIRESCGTSSQSFKMK